MLLLLLLCCSTPLLLRFSAFTLVTTALSCFSFAPAYTFSRSPLGLYGVLYVGAYLCFFGFVFVFVGVGFVRFFRGAAFHGG